MSPENRISNAPNERKLKIFPPKQLVFNGTSALTPLGSEIQKLMVLRAYLEAGLPEEYKPTPARTAELRNEIQELATKLDLLIDEKVDWESVDANVVILNPYFRKT